jgi:hypothetical protein
VKWEEPDLEGGMEDEEDDDEKEKELWNSELFSQQQMMRKIKK